MLIVANVAQNLFLKLDVAYDDAGNSKRIITRLRVINVKQNNNLKDKLDRHEY